MEIEIKSSISDLNKSSKKLLKLLKDYDKYSEEKDVIKLERNLLKLETVIQELLEVTKDGYGYLLEWIAKQTLDFKKIKEEYKYKFGLQLEEIMKASGRTLTGNIATTLESGLFKIKANFEKSLASIFIGPDLVQRNFRLNPSLIAKKINIIERELKYSKFDPEIFVKDIFQIYSNFLEKESSTSINQGKVPIIKILFEYTLSRQKASFLRNPIKQNFKGYSRWNFGYDLYRLFQLDRAKRIINNKELVLVTAPLDKTRNKKDFLWIPENEKGEGRPIAYIQFKETV